MNNFLSITQHIIESNTGGSTGDMFKTACEVSSDGTIYFMCVEFEEM